MLPSCRYYNGAVIIGKKHVLTAASQIRTDTDPKSTTVLFGTDRIGGYKNTTRRYVSRVAIHPQFNATNKFNDIAVLVLLRELEFSDTIKPIQLPPQDAQIEDGKGGVMSGWGVHPGSGGTMETKLVYAKIKTVNREKCNQTFITQLVTEDMICASAYNITPCYGDHGGPLVIDNVLHGITSWAGPCGISAYPGVFTRVAKFVNWIQNETQTRN